MTATCNRYDIVKGKFGERHEVKSWDISADGNNIIVDGYSMLVEGDPTGEFVFQIRRKYIRANNGIDGLLKHIRWEIERSPVYQCGRGVTQIVNWVTTYGQKKENI